MQRRRGALRPWCASALLVLTVRAVNYPCIVGCKLWFDGCNTCTTCTGDNDLREGKSAECTEKACDAKEAKKEGPKCLDCICSGTLPARFGSPEASPEAGRCSLPAYCLRPAVMSWCGRSWDESEGAYVTGGRSRTTKNGTTTENNEGERARAADQDKYGEIGEWDVSQITDMSQLFANQDTCNPPIGKWNVGQVKDMDRMFDGASEFDRDLNNWKVDQVTSMDRMFQGATAFNQLLCWDIADVRITDDWLYGSAAALLGPGERSEEAGVCAFNLTTQPFAPSSKELLKYAARRWCRNQTETKTTFGPIGTWNVSEITDMSELFKDQATCNPNVTRWKVNKVTDMSSMFMGAKKFDRDLSSWDVGQVEIMAQMFEGATTFNQNISGWKVRRVKNMYQMFVGATNFSQTLCWEIEGKYTDGMEVVTKEGRKDWLAGSQGSEGDFNATTGVCEEKTESKEDSQIHWILLGLAAAAAVLVYVLVKVISEDQLDEPPPTLWEQIKTVLARVTGLDDQKLSADFDRRSSSSDSSVVQIHTASPTEAYTVIQALSTTSSGTLTQMVVQQLQATNYTGSMPTMITAVVQSVSQEGGASSSSGSASMTLVIAVSVAGGLLLVASLVVGALVYLWRSSRSAPGTTGQEATLPVVGMGAVADVGIETNPMHH